MERLALRVEDVLAEGGEAGLASHAEVALAVAALLALASLVALAFGIRSRPRELGAEPEGVVELAMEA